MAAGPKNVRMRAAGRWLVLVAAVALAWPGKWSAWTALWLPALSPYVAVGAAMAVRAVSVISLLAVPVMCLVIISPRWFCRYACPTGFLQDLLGKFRPARPSWTRWPRIGRWLLVLTLGGALAGYPIFLWLDPLALFNGFFHAWSQPFSAMLLVSAAGLPALLLMTLLAPGLWCRRLCPLGALQELLVRHPRTSAGPGRREFMVAGAGAAGAWATGNLRTRRKPPLRPPGSVAEGRFVGVCVRCGNCVQVCPSHILHQDCGGHGIAGFLAPVVSFDGTDYCREDCIKCGLICPSGAITSLTLTDKRARVIGSAAVNLQTCRLVNGGECTACISKCPYQALSIETSADGFSNMPLLDMTKCTGCGACEVACPVTPKAIRVTPGWGSLV